MIVVAIIAILAAFLAPSVSKYMHRSKGQSAARSVVNTLRGAQNQALSRGEVVLATVSTRDASGMNGSGGRIELFLTDNRSSDECDVSSDEDFRETTNPDCFARTCSQAQNMDTVSVHTVDFGDSHPDMMILDTDPGPTSGQLTFCFSPSGQVLGEGGQSLEPTGEDCDGTNARIFVRENSDATDLSANPVFGSPNLIKCTDVSDGSNDAKKLRQQQKDGRDVANFYAIYVSYNGAISLRQ